MYLDDYLMSLQYTFDAHTIEIFVRNRRFLSFTNFRKRKIIAFNRSTREVKVICFLLCAKMYTISSINN